MITIRPKNPATNRMVDPRNLAGDAIRNIQFIGGSQMAKTSIARSMHIITDYANSNSRGAADARAWLRKIAYPPVVDEFDIQPPKLKINLGQQYCGKESAEYDTINLTGFSKGDNGVPQNMRCTPVIGGMWSASTLLYHEGGHTALEKDGGRADHEGRPVGTQGKTNNLERANDFVMWKNANINQLNAKYPINPKYRNFIQPVKPEQPRPIYLERRGNMGMNNALPRSQQPRNPNINVYYTAQGKLAGYFKTEKSNGKSTFWKTDINGRYAQQQGKYIQVDPYRGPIKSNRIPVDYTSARQNPVSGATQNGQQVWEFLS